MASASHETGVSSQADLDKTNAPIFIRPDIEPFRACRADSIDYAVLEHFAELAVVPFKGQWCDVGSWNSIADLTPTDSSGNGVGGQGIALHSQNTFTHAPHPAVVSMGTDNLLFIVTPDALLVVQRDHVEKVKEKVTRLKKD